MLAQSWKTFFLVLAVLAIPPGTARSQDEKARAYFYAAESAYAAKRYAEALTSVEKTEKLLGQKNALTASLRIKIFYSTGQHQKAKAELDSFFKLKPSDELSREISEYVIKIDRALALNDARTEEIRKREAKKLEQRRRNGILLDQLTEQFVAIPAGRALLGKPKIYDASYTWEPDRYRTVVSFAPFRIMSHEVTRELWNVCVFEEVCKKPSLPNYDKLMQANVLVPVSGVSYKQIVATFIPWIRKKTGLQVRLPSRSEWEYAARAGTNTKYYWGDEISCLNVQDDNTCGRLKSMAIKQYPPNPWGLYDMIGSVLELTADRMHFDHMFTPADGSPAKIAHAEYPQSRAAMGGYSINYSEMYRGKIDPVWNVTPINDDYSARHVGFRLVLDF
jgi:formylglycine-generating enzyme required for sulfatase activity